MIYVHILSIPFGLFTTLIILQYLVFNVNRLYESFLKK
ncbi:hypothetical protein UVUMRFZT_CDS0077 [Staphylococcus phage LJLAME001]